MQHDLLTIILVTLVLPLALTACDANNPQTSASAALEPSQVTANTTSIEVAQAQDAASTGGEPIELEWDALIPEDWRLDNLMQEYNSDNLSDDDPRAKQLMAKLKQFWKEAPVVHDYDGKLIKLPGFVVPLETDAKTIQDFLLVPYYGACIHTPPPPANQTVYVVTDQGHAYQGELFDTVWVTGTLRVDKLSSEFGDAGYRIESRLVEPYE
ncbi:MAG: DUF3299 domain-containing protein [Candidatus Thiodiazotropha sp.]